MGRCLCYTAVKGQHTDMHNISCFYTDRQHLLSVCVRGQCSLPCETHPFDKCVLDAYDVAGTDLGAEGQQATNTQTLKCKLYQMIKM